MIRLDAQTLREVAPSLSGARGARQAEIIAGVGEVLGLALARAEIGSRLRIAHFLAQAAHESAGFSTLEEFHDGSQYEGRADLGNTQPGDGVRYKGRGLLQLTGRNNYREYGRSFRVDLEAEPWRAAEPELSLAIACEYWRRRKCNDDADRDNLLAVTKKVNGGTNGLQDRREMLARAKAALARLEGFRVEGAVPNSEGRPVLRRSSKGPAVSDLQKILRDKFHFPLAVDADFGAATELAVQIFQKYKGLPDDGICGPKTWAALV